MRIKKIVIGILLVFAFFICGCGSEKSKMQKEYNIYCLHRSENYISAIPYEISASKEEVETVVKELLKELSIQTKDIEYKPVIQGFVLKDCILHESQVTLNFSEEYAMMESAREVLVRAAIVKTLTQVEGIELVSIQVNGRNLEDSLGNPVGVMSADTFIDNTGKDMKKYEEVTLTLYFADSSGKNLKKVNRTMRYNTNISLEKLVVEQLVFGPIDKKNKGAGGNIFATLNPEIKIISVNIKDGVCYVNLNNAFLTLVDNVTVDTAIYSLVNSLTELPGVLKVQIAVDGETEVKFGEKTLSTLFERNPDIVQMEESRKMG